MVEYANRWVKGCNKCATRKHPKHNKRAPLQTYRVGATGDRYSSDLCGPFNPPTKNGKQWILTITDWYTRYVKAYSLRRASADKVAMCMYDYITTFGCPLELYTDNGRNIDGQVVHELCKYMGVQKLATVPYRPSSNGTMAANAAKC